MAAVIAAPPNLQFFDDNGVPIAGGFVYTYAAGTMTPKATYTDYTGTIPVTNPVELDAAGRPKTIGAIWLEAGGSYKFVVTNASLVQVGDPIDNVTAFSTASGLAVLGTIAANTLVGNNTGAPATPTALTIAQVATMLNTSLSTSGGFINKFRNPTLDINQRGLSGSVTTGNANYTSDGWILGATGATLTWSITAAANSGSYWGLNFTGNTSMTDTFLKQRIESYLAVPMAGQVCIVQFNLSNNTGAPLTPTLTVKHAGTQDSWGAPVTDVNAVAMSTIAASTNQTIAYAFTASASSYLGMEVTLDFGAAQNANTKTINFYYADIRVATGTTVGIITNPPTAERRLIGTELPLNQRYLTTTFGNNNAPATNFGLAGALGAEPYGATAGMLYTQWNYPVQMRAAPTITTYNPSAANANWRSVTGSSDIVVSVDPDTAKGIAGVLIASQTTALTAGHRCYIHAQATSEL